MCFAGCAWGVGAEDSAPAHFPPALDSYTHAADASVGRILLERVRAHPFNLVATLIFFLAITHTFLAPFFMGLAHRFEAAHRKELAAAGKPVSSLNRKEVSFKAEIFHFLGEVEAIFGIWVVPLVIAITFYGGWGTARGYIGHGLNFTEPMFVVVIMTMAASRPMLRFAERLLSGFASLGRGSIAAWWLSILTIGPLLGSFITEPAAMTISALLLADRFYKFAPRPAFAYATLGLLFVNVSVGGTLTHFAAPPVLMVAGKWGWGFKHMFLNFGLEATLAILVANVVYFFWFRKEFASLKAAEALIAAQAEKRRAEEPVPLWITAVHTLFLIWTVVNNHYPVLFIGGFLFYIAFTRATEHHQSDLALRPALLVGFFLAGLVVHGGLQGWWIGPVLRKLPEVPLFLGATVLTAFNDNAAITYLASLVPNFTDELKHAVVAGAVTGGGLTVIANAPNPAGQSILSKFFPDGVSPLGLFLGALLPTVIVAIAFLVLR
jgi:hypothetical protein